MIEVNGEMVPRWSGILTTLSELKIGDEEPFDADEWAAEFQNQLRVMLNQDKRTCKFHWSVRREGNTVTAKKLEPWLL